MPARPPPPALLLLSSQCPHCPAVLAGLVDLLKRAVIGRLEAINVQADPQAAAELGVRTVPWLRLGSFELTGPLTPVELETWARRASSPDGMADAFHDFLKAGDAAQVLRRVDEEPGRLAALLPIVANPEASLNVRLGAGMVLEEHAGGAALRALVPGLCQLSRHGDARVRADAAHFLGLARDPSARPCLEALRADADPDVREIAGEGLEASA